MLTAIDEQSPDIAQGVDKGLEQREGDSADELDSAGAGDQGMMFGYATPRDQGADADADPGSPTSSPGSSPRSARPGSSPTSAPTARPRSPIRYENDRPVEIAKVLISTQHREEAGEQMIRNDLWEHVLEPVLHTEYKELFTEKELLENFLVNPTGKFVIGGPVGDAGLTGRKIIVDTYGGAARHGGGAFSGKDPSKVDRSAAYAARYVAKNVVAAGLADRCEVQVAYAIGVAHPVSVMAQTFGTGKLSDAEIARLVQENFDLRPGGFPQATSTCTGRSSRRPPPTATSAARTPTSPGSGPTAPISCAMRPGWRPTGRRHRSVGEAGATRDGGRFGRAWWRSRPRARPRPGGR